MLHVTGVIISTVCFLHLLRMGHEEKRLHCLDWACDCWVKEGICFNLSPPFEVRGDGKHVGRYRLNRLPLASVLVYHREHTGPKRVEPKLKFLFIVA